MSHILVELQDWMGSDQSIANAAWTSTYDKDRREMKYDDKSKVDALIRRMAEEGHAVPFESVVLRFWIRMPIYTDRQHMTHRIASHNGLSGRYRTMPDDWYGMPDDVKKIHDKSETLPNTGWSKLFDDCCFGSHRIYLSAVKRLREAEKAGLISNAEFKRAREIWRGILPLASMTERTTQLNLRSFANYIRLRRSSHAQPEIYQVADRMLDQVRQANICPVALESLEAVGWRI